MRVVRVIPLSLLVILSGWLVTLTGCAGTRPSGPAPLLKTPEMEQAFQQAERLYYAKRFPEAGLRYRAYLEQFPSNELTSKANFRLGDIALNGGNPAKASGFYEKSLERGIPPEWGTTALYKKAVAHFRLEDYKKVFQTLDRMPAQEMDGSLLVRAASLRVSAARKSQKKAEKGDPQEMRGYLELVDAYERLPASEQNIGDLNWIVSEKRALEAVRDWAEDPEQPVGPLKNLLKSWNGRRSAAYLLWKIGFQAHRKGDYEESVRTLQQYLAQYPKHEYASRARTLLAELDKREAVTRLSVGVILPLSGPYGVYGESVLHGLECAAGVFQPCRGDLGLNLILRDTQGDPKIAAQAVQELSEDPSIKVVIGPLPQVEVDATAKVAETKGMPLVALSQRKGVAALGDFIFRNFLTVTDQVSTLVRYACEDKGWKKFAILYPKGEEEYADAFAEAVDRCGGKVVGKTSYGAGTRDFTEPLRILKSSAGRVGLGEEIPFDTLFIPDVYRRVPAILEGLRFLKMEKVHLLGGAGWDNPGLVQGGEEKVPEGAVFVDGFFAGGGGYATRDFVSSFKAGFGIEPTLLEAYAYDTLRLVGQILRDHPTASREEIRQALARLRNYEGVTGSISFDDEGDAHRRLFLLTVDRGEIREVR